MSHPTRSDGRHPAMTRLFHWGTVLLLVAMFTLIWIAGWFGPGPQGSWLVALHRSVGVLLFFVVLMRLVWRLSHPFAPSKIHAPVWEHRLAATVQFLLYASLLAMPLLGWAASDTAGDTVHVFGIATLPSLLTMDEDRSNLLFNIHGWVATGLLTCAALHVLGALRHRFVLGDKVLERML
jgi:cytochrome b561